MYCFVTIAQVQYSRVTQLNFFFNCERKYKLSNFSKIIIHLLYLHSIALVVTQSKNQGPLLPQELIKANLKRCTSNWNSTKM